MITTSLGRLYTGVGVGKRKYAGESNAHLGENKTDHLDMRTVQAGCVSTSFHSEGIKKRKDARVRWMSNIF